jgi:hypothetical protein
LIIAFFTGLIQVFLVAFQTRQIAKESSIWAIILVSVGISTVWVFNVRAVTTDWISALAYIIGAGIGTGGAMLVKIKSKK